MMHDSDYSDDDEGEQERGEVQSFLKRYSSAADNLGDLSDMDNMNGDLSDADLNGQMCDPIGAAPDNMLNPLREQVDNMGVDVAVLDETLHTLIAQTEGANSKIAQVTNFVVDLIERLEDIDYKAKVLMEKWSEESQIASELTENADEISGRLNKCMETQEIHMEQMHGLLARLENETTRLTATSRPHNHSQREQSTIPRRTPSPTKCIDERIVEHLKVDDPENIDFHAKRNAFFVQAEKGKSNDTYQSFKANGPSLRGSSEKIVTSQTLPEKLENDSENKVSHGATCEPPRNLLLYIFVVFIAFAAGFCSAEGNLNYLAGLLDETVLNFQMAMSQIRDILMDKK